MKKGDKARISYIDLLSPGCPLQCFEVELVSRVRKLTKQTELWKVRPLKTNKVKEHYVSAYQII